jgi:hypothetical protein
MNLWSKTRYSKQEFVTHLNDFENKARKRKKLDYYKTIAANQNVNRNINMSKKTRIPFFSTVRTIYHESAEATPQAFMSILMFTIAGLLISSLNYLMTSGNEFSNAYSVIVLLMGQVSVFYITQNSVIHGTTPAVREMIKSKTFWLYALGVILLYLTFILVLKLSMMSISNGWGGFFKFFDIKPEAYGFPDIDKIAVTTSVLMILLFARKLAFMLPEIIAGRSLNFFKSWKIMKVGNLKFWGTLIIVMAPLLVLAVGYSYVRTPYLITQVLTQVLTYFLVTLLAIVFSATGAVFWKITAGEKSPDLSHR